MSKVKKKPAVKTKKKTTMKQAAMRKPRSKAEKTTPMVDPKKVLKKAMENPDLVKVAKKRAAERVKAEKAARAAVKAEAPPKLTPTEKRAAKIAAIKKGCYDALALTTKEIAHRLKQANQLDGKADDHRLAAALKLGEAKKVSEKHGVRFSVYVKDNLSEFSWENARKLALVGIAPNPAKALADLRHRNKENNAAARERAKEALPSPDKAIAAITQPVEAGETVAGLETAKELFNRLPATEKMTWLRWAAEEVGAEIKTEF